MSAPSEVNASPRLLARWWPWTVGYDRPTARTTLIAGSTLAAYAVPSSIAYAQLAGMPVQTGLYCYLFAGIVYALFGTSRQLAVGPTSSIALTLAVDARRDGPRRSRALRRRSRRPPRSSSALIALFAAAMRWGGIVHFISETVLTGFKIGAGIVIAVSQLPLLLGLAGQRAPAAHAGAHCAPTRAAPTCPRWSFGMVAFARPAGSGTRCGRAGRFR